MNSNAHSLNFDRLKRGRKTARLNKFIAETRNKNCKSGKKPATHTVMDKSRDG